jgi:hypothetical protein
LRIKCRVNATLPYNISSSEEAIVAVLPVNQVVHVASVSSGTRGKRGWALTDVGIDARGACGIMATRAVDSVEFDAHVGSSVVAIVV